MSCPHVTKSELVGDEAGWCVVCLRSEVKDLKARLRWLKKNAGLDLPIDAYGPDQKTLAVLDLKNENWRKA